MAEAIVLFAEIPIPLKYTVAAKVYIFIKNHIRLKLLLCKHEKTPASVFFHGTQTVNSLYQINLTFLIYVYAVKNKSSMKNNIQFKFLYKISWYFLQTDF